MKVKILVACHKKDVMASVFPYEPIHVGKELNSQLNLGITCDNTGSNISDKNASFCELTALYWAWKNLKDIDVIGLCHYRRYFDFHNQCQKFVPFTEFNASDFDNLDLSVPDEIINKVVKGEIVVAKKIDYYVPLSIDYCISHISDDYRILSHVIHTTQEKKYIDAFESFMQNNSKMSNFNMFIMKWSDFDAYCSWLFDILDNVEKITDISSYTVFQKRIYGYMAERLFNVWLLAERKETIHKPIMWIKNGTKLSVAERIKHCFKSWYCSCLSSLYPFFKIMPDLDNPNNAYYLHSK